VFLNFRKSQETRMNYLLQRGPEEKLFRRGIRKNMVKVFLNMNLNLSLANCNLTFYDIFMKYIWCGMQQKIIFPIRKDYEQKTEKQKSKVQINARKKFLRSN